MDEPNGRNETRSKPDWLPGKPDDRRIFETLLNTNRQLRLVINDFTNKTLYKDKTQCEWPTLNYDKNLPTVPHQKVEELLTTTFLIPDRSGTTKWGGTDGIEHSIQLPSAGSRSVSGLNWVNCVRVVHVVWRLTKKSKQWAQNVRTIEEQNKKRTCSERAKTACVYLKARVPLTM